MAYRLQGLMITVIPDSIGFDIFHDPDEESSNGANGHRPRLASPPPPDPDSPLTSPPPNGPDELTSPPPNGPDELTSPPPNGPDAVASPPPNGPDAVASPPPNGPDAVVASPPPDPPEQLSRQPLEAMELRMLLQFALAQLGGPLSAEEMRPRTLAELDALEGRLGGALEEVRSLRVRFGP